MSQPSAEKLDAFGNELNALHQEAMRDLGQRDADHIRGMIRLQRYAEIGGRGLLFFGFNPITWPLGVALLSVSKILNNMEIGHNVMHGQYDWMNDPEIHSQRHNWDNICDPNAWRKTHNFEHHVHTNIIGKDRDFGYGAFRMSEDIPWEPKHRYQLQYYVIMAILFQWGVGLHDLEADRIRNKEITRESKLPVWQAFLKRMRKHLLKDYVVFPLLAGFNFFGVFFGNLLGLGFSWLQQKFQIIKLSEADYYLSYAPIKFDWMTILVLNMGTLVITTLFLLLPTIIVLSITPVKALRFK